MKLSTYEGMFLFDPSVATQWETVEKEIGRIMQRAGAELIGVKRWDERRLAYEIKHRKRACYVLTYFKCPSASIVGIERDARLSEIVLRLLVLRCTLNDDQLSVFGREAADQCALLRSGAQQPSRPEGAEDEGFRSNRIEPSVAEPIAAAEPADIEVPEEVTRAEAEALWSDTGNDEPRS